jgi:hypothetical protein
MLGDMRQAASWIQEHAMQDLQGQNLMDLGRIVPVPAEVSLNNSFERIPLEVRP